MGGKSDGITGETIERRKKLDATNIQKYWYDYIGTRLFRIRRSIEEPVTDSEATLHIKSVGGKKNRTRILHTRTPGAEHAKQSSATLGF